MRAIIRFSVHDLFELYSSICYSAVPNVSCRLFRSYPTRHASYNPTIVEAIRATWARPGLFSSIRVGAGPLQEELVSSMSGFDNPTLEAIKEAKDVFGGDTKISSILSLGCGKKRVANGTDTSETAENAQEAERVTGVLQRHLDTSGVYYRLSVEEGIEDSFTDIETHLQSVVAHTQGYLTDDTVSCSIDSYLKLSQHPSPFGLGEVCKRTFFIGIFTLNRVLQTLIVNGPIIYIAMTL